jgi:hypothetical protein
MEVHAADGRHVATSTIPGYSYGCPYTFAGDAVYLRTGRGLIKIRRER